MFAAILSLLLPGKQVFADALVVTEAMNATTIAEVFIEGKTVRVEFEIGASDIPAFANLMPDEIYAELGNTPVPMQERAKKFFAEDFLLIPGDSEPLQGRIVSMGPEIRVQRDAVTGEALPDTSQEGETVILIRLIYAYSGQPENLTIAMGPAMQTTSIGYVAYHKSVAVNDLKTKQYNFLAIFKRL